MTKPAVCMTIMMLAEQGLLAISDPVEKYLPEFRGQMVGETDKSVRLVKPVGPVQIRDLMTHTWGMPQNPPPGIGELHGSLHKNLAGVILRWFVPQRVVYLCNAIAKFAQISPQLIPNAPEDIHPFFFSADAGGWRIFKAVMQYFRRTEEHRTGFTGIVADRDYIIEVLPLEFIDVFGAIPGDINPYLAHDSDGFGPDTARFRTGAFYIETIPSIIA